MSDLMERVERALRELVGPGDDADLIWQNLREAARDTDLSGYTRKHYERLLTACQRAEIDQTPDEPMRAVEAAHQQALAALFRLAFEAGRVDEKSQALPLHILAGLDEEEGGFD